MSIRFDAAYYRRYYLEPRTRIYTQERHASLVAGVVGLVEWLGGALDSVLDVGAGLGWWGQWLAANRPKVSVLSTELEADTCARYGHRQADIRTFRLEQHFDLVVCQGVLPYLDLAGVRQAIGNLAAMCGGFLYLEAITREDVKGAIDEGRTDMRVALRPAAFYRRHLAPHFLQVGAGLFAARSAGLPLYALERPPPARRR